MRASLCSCEFNHVELTRSCGFSGPMSGVHMYEKEYLGSVQQMALSVTHCAALCDGKIHIHPLDSHRSTTEERILPHQGVTSMVLCGDILLYSTSQGTLHHYHCIDSQQLNEFHHTTNSGTASTGGQSVPIQWVSAAPSAPHLLATPCIAVFGDARGRAFLYSAVDDRVLEISNFPVCDRVLWDISPSVTVLHPSALGFPCFAAVDLKTRTLQPFVYEPMTLRGPSFRALAATKFPHHMSPLFIQDGIAFGLRPNGSITSISLASHDALVALTGSGHQRRSSDKLRTCFAQCLLLGRFRSAWDVALNLHQPELWSQLAARALDCLHVDLAVECYREMRQPAMVQALQRIATSDDTHFVAGTICLLLGDYQRAQQLFLASSQPLCALQMRQDLHHWEQALQLASTLAPAQIPLICRQYAQQCEIRSEYQQALDLYNRALTAVPGPTGAPVALPATHLRSVSS